MSVSGYILAPPGNGRIGVVVPSSGEPFFITTFLTSLGILSKAIIALVCTLSNAKSACHFGARHSTKASTSDNFDLTISMWLCSIPYAGNSSEWKIPATPASFAAPANSLPKRGIWAPSSSNSFFPIRPENPGKGSAII